MAVEQGSVLFAGDVSKAAIYQIANGLGFVWGDHVKTEVMIGGKPRQLTIGKHVGNPITPNVSNPRRPADFPAGNTIVINGRELNVARFKSDDTWDTSDWLDSFPEFMPTGTSIDLQMNPEIREVVFSLLMNATHSQLNENHSNGDSAGAAPINLYDGFVQLILADGDATPVGTPAVLTAANIVSKVFELRNAVEPRLRNKPNLKIFSSYADADLFDEAARLTQTDLPITTLRGQNSITPAQANGSTINIIPMEGIPKNFMFITVADKSDMSNLVQGVWVPKDVDALKLYREVEVDEVWNLLMRFSAGVQYKTGEDIWYLNNV